MYVDDDDAWAFVKVSKLYRLHPIHIPIQSWALKKWDKKFLPRKGLFWISNIVWDLAFLDHFDLCAHMDGVIYHGDDMLPGVEKFFSFLQVSQT